jgi:hypothetical protein
MALMQKPYKHTNDKNKTSSITILTHPAACQWLPTVIHLHVPSRDFRFDFVSNLLFTNCRNVKSYTIQKKKLELEKTLDIF